MKNATHRPSVRPRVRPGWIDCGKYTRDYNCSDEDVRTMNACATCVHCSPYSGCAVTKRGRDVGGRYLSLSGRYIGGLDD